jgi:hypothetical protein
LNVRFGAAAGIRPLLGARPYLLDNDIGLLVGPVGHVRIFEPVGPPMNLNGPAHANKRKVLKEILNQRSKAAVSQSTETSC